MFQAIKTDYSLLTVGTVVDTNDPQGRGRMRIYSMALGDLPNTPIEDIPWCRQVTPFGGVVSTPDTMSRGPHSTSTTTGPVAYGMWGVPKVGAIAVISCLDGDSANRIWLGCMHPMATEHTMPHGRYIEKELEKGKDGKKGKTVIDGPVSSAEQPIQPLYDNLRTAFSGTADDIIHQQSFEWHTRAIDTSVTGLSQEVIDTKQMLSQKPDIKSGYKSSRINPDLKVPNAPKVNFDPQIYSWTSPGFHAVSMEDSPDNCRLKIRTASGHQIIMDDTNERIYISTAEGANWIEFDQDGTIDVYATHNVSIHSADDINLTSAKSIRLTAGTSIHLAATEEVRSTSGKETHILANTNLRIQSVDKFFQEAGDTIDITSGTDTNLTVNAVLNILSIDNTNLTVNSVLNILSTDATKITADGLNLRGGGSIKQTAGRIDLNGPAADKAAEAAEAAPAKTIAAFLTNRIPNHEPWGRTGTKDDYTHVPKYPYKSDEIGRDYKKRNPNWKR